MFHLETFGGLSLSAAAGPELATQRRKLALLALLAAAGERGLSRDRLVAFLWPESGNESARHSLEQLLYLLRRQLDEDLFVGSDPLHLNQQIITSDVGRFEQALARGADADAVPLYRGPFLDGFYLGEAGDFQEWVDVERARLVGEYAGALTRLAERSAQAGDLNGAVAFWRKLVALDTLSSRNLLGLVRSLAAAGDRAEALRVAATYEALLREQLDIPLEPALQAFVQELRGSSDRALQSSRGTAASPALNESQIATTPSSVTLPSNPNRVDSEKHSRTGRRVRRWPVLVTGVVLLIAMTWATRSATKSTPDPALDPHRILIVPFRVTGADSSLAYLREGMLDLLAAKLTGPGGSTAVDPRTTLGALRRAASKRGDEFSEGALFAVARSLGASQLLLGEVVAVGGQRMVVNGQVISTLDGRSRVRASVTGPTNPPDSVLALVDQLAARLLALQAQEHPQRIASLTTQSTEALRAFLEGRAEHRRGNDAAARALYARALDQDSTFALAALELSLASARVFRWSTISSDSIFRTRGVTLGREGPSQRSDEDQWEHAMEVAWHGRDRLTPADQAVLRALRGDNYLGPSYARDVLANWERAVRAAPDRAEAHYWLGYVLLTQGPALGLLDSRVRARASFARALDLDSTFVRPLSGMLEIAALDGDTEALRRLRSLYLARDSIGEDADYVQWLAAVGLGDQDALRAIRARFNSLHMSALNRILRMSQVHGVALEDAERASAAMLRRVHESQERQITLHYTVILALNRGRPKQALQLMALKIQVDPDSGLYQGYALRYAAMFEADSRAAHDAARAFEASLAQPMDQRALTLNPQKATFRSFSLGLWRLWHQDTTGAVRAIEQLRRLGTAATKSQADLLDALLASAVKRPDAGNALARLDSLARRGFGDQPHFIDLVTARLHERAGDLPAALAAIRRGRWVYPPEYLSTHLREEGRLADLTGDRAGAISAYRHYLALRSNPEPSLQPAVNQVRAELARLERKR